MTTPVDYSIVVPAYNEAELLPRTLTALRRVLDAIPHLRGEIVVANNNSTDRTAAVAAAHGARVVFEPINQISRARNCGAAAALGRYLIFVDADTIASPELVAAALAERGHRLVVESYSLEWMQGRMAKLYRDLKEGR